MTPITPEKLHACYCEQLQQSVLMRCHWERLWLEYIRAGFTLDDLRLVLKYLLRELRGGRRNPGALKLSNLLQIDRFEEDLLVARMQLQRNRTVIACPPPSHQRKPRIETDQERSQNLDLLRSCRIQLARRIPPH